MSCACRRAHTYWNGWIGAIRSCKGTSKSATGRFTSHSGTPSRRPTSAAVMVKSVNAMISGCCRRKGACFRRPRALRSTSFAASLTPKFDRSNQIRSHRNRDALARGKIPCEAKAREANQHHCPGRGLSISLSRCSHTVRLESSPGEECWLRAPPHIGQELCQDYVVDLFFATITLHSNHGNRGSTHFVSRKTGLAIKTVLGSGRTNVPGTSRFPSSLSRGLAAFRDPRYLTVGGKADFHCLQRPRPTRHQGVHGSLE